MEKDHDLQQLFDDIGHDANNFWEVGQRGASGGAIMPLLNPEEVTKLMYDHGETVSEFIDDAIGLKDITFTGDDLLYYKYCIKMLSIFGELVGQQIADEADEGHSDFADLYLDELKTDEYYFL